MKYSGGGCLRCAVPGETRRHPVQLQQSFADVPGEATWSWLMQDPCGSWIVEHQESLGICALQQCLVHFAQQIAVCQ